MSHLLVDVDSKIPNLALMRISAYLKARSESVSLLRMNSKAAIPSDWAELSATEGWDTVWISCIFTWNRELATKLAEEFKTVARTPVLLGGSGISLRVKLPDEIEQMVPDYDLYGDDRAIGFVQRGCIRKCQFCIVPQKEGKLSENQYRPLETWVPPGFKKVLLLDNEFAAMPYEKEVLDTAHANGWRLSITQGYDLRCVTEEKAGWLANDKPWDLKFGERRLYTAWDYLGIEPYVRRGIERLKKAGFKGRDMMTFCLSGFNTSHLQDYYRFHVLWKEYQVLPFVMRYNLRKDDKWLNKFARFVNRGPASYRNHSVIDYMKSPKGALDLVDETVEIVEHVESGKPVPLSIPYQQPEMKEWYDMGDFTV